MAIASCGLLSVANWNSHFFTWVLVPPWRLALVCNNYTVAGNSDVMANYSDNIVNQREVI